MSKKYIVDEICFNSDKKRYILDTGESDSKNRISIFKDGKGFLNFRIYDKGKEGNSEVQVYNLATNIKHFKPGEAHHIAASWKLNTDFEKDEMHLFLDGLEAPNLYKFGGSIPVRLNDKFSDVGKEMLHDYVVGNILFCNEFKDGEISAGTSSISSSSAGFTEGHIGRSILISNAGIAPTYVGKEYIITSVSGNTAYLAGGMSLAPVEFSTSTSNVTFSFPPTAGVKSPVLSDLKNGKFSIFRKIGEGDSKEIGGILYSVENGDIKIISGENVSNPQYRANISDRIIEFVGKNSDCNYDSSVNFSDTAIYIETYGLLSQRCNKILNLSSSSYHRLDKISNNPNSGKSVIITRETEPVSLKDVSIQRILLNKTIPKIDTSIKRGFYYESDFSIDLDPTTSMISSEPGQVYTANLGRYVSLDFDSDNVFLCDNNIIDGYVDGYIGEAIDYECDSVTSLVAQTQKSIRRSKLFGAYAWTAFDGTVPIGKYREDQDDVVKILKDLGCNLYARSSAEGVSPSVEAQGESFYYGNRVSSNSPTPVLSSGIFDIVYDYSGGYGPDKSAWDEFIELLEKTKGTGIKVYASSGEKHHLRNTKDNEDGTYVIYPDRWGMHAQSTPEESTQSLMLRMRELAQMTLPVEQGGLGYDHLVGLLHDDTSNSVGQGLNNPGDYEFGYTPAQIFKISEAARSINPNFEFIPTVYYQTFGPLFANDGIELGCRTSVNGVTVQTRPAGLIPPSTVDRYEWLHEKGPEGASAYYKFEKPDTTGPVKLSFSYQDHFRPQDEEGEVHYAAFLDRGQKLHKECFINGNLIFSKDLTDNNIISFFESEDISSHLIDGENTIEFRFWNKQTVAIGYIPKIVWLWDIELSANGNDISNTLKAPTFYVNDKDLSQGHISSPKMFARSNSIKNISKSLSSVSFVYPKNLTGDPQDHERDHFAKVLKMVRKHVGDINFIEQERAYAWGSPIEPDIFEMKLDEASKVADGVLVYNLVVETLRQHENEGVFREPRLETELQYSKVAWTPANYAPKNGYFREWKTHTELSGTVTFDIFIPGGLVSGTVENPDLQYGFYDFYIYDDNNTLLYSNHNGNSNASTHKLYASYGYGVGLPDEFGNVQPVVLTLDTPTKLRFLWKNKNTYGSVYNYLKFRIVLGSMDRSYFGKGAIYNEASPGHVKDSLGNILEVYPRDSYSYNAGIDLVNEETYKYKEIIEKMQMLYRHVLADQIIYNEETGLVCSNSINFITIHGKTIDGTNKETFYLYKNGKIRGKKLFKTIDKVDGKLFLADPDYEPCVIEVVESDPVSVQNNGGEYAEVFRYFNGTFQLTSVGSAGTHPFELHPGSWRLDYPSFLKVGLPYVGGKTYVGSDKSGANQFGGTIDEFRIISEMSGDTRPTETYTSGVRSITRDFYSPNQHCPDDQTLCLIHFDDPIALQSRRLRQKEFLNTENNFKYKLSLSDRENLLSSINDKERFISKMLRLGYSLDDANKTFYECHKAQGGPIFNEVKLTQKLDFLSGANSVNDSFGLSGRFFETRPMIINNRYSYFRKNEGTIEFWVSPLLDTVNDLNERFYIDIYSATRKRLKSIKPNRIILPTAAKKIDNIILLRDKKEFSSFYSQDQKDEILFDEIYRSKKTGFLEGGTGTEKDFSAGCELSADGKVITLKQALPGSEVDVLVTYVPVDSNGDRVSVYKNEHSQIVFSIKAGDVENIITKNVDWKRNSWHRIMCTYKTGTNSDTMRIFIDGEEGGFINYGQKGVVYGNGFVYGQKAKQDGASKQLYYNIKLKDEFRIISVGSDFLANKPAVSRMDNLRFSRIMRDAAKSSVGNYIDSNYSSNLNTVRPVVSDDATTFVLNFEPTLNEDYYATLIDPKRGIFNFNINVKDPFGKINSNEIEDLIVELVNRLKATHTDALVVFPRDPC